MNYDDIFSNNLVLFASIQFGQFTLVIQSHMVMKQSLFISGLIMLLILAHSFKFFCSFRRNQALSPIIIHKYIFYLLEYCSKPL